jgi:hypothetical protein
MITVDEPIDRAFHQRRMAEEEAAARDLPACVARSMHLELAALHRLALERSATQRGTLGLFAEI